MKKNILWLGLIFLCGCAYFGYLKDPFVDIPNFYRIDEVIYRGGQPNEKGIEKLHSLGIKTVVSLKGGNEKPLREKQQLESLGIKFYNLPMSVYQRPTDEQVLTFLEILLTRDNQPVFVHCESGRDRTGAMIAIYRVLVSGKTIKQAYKEAKGLGFWPYHGDAELKNFIHQLKDKKIYFEKVAFLRAQPENLNEPERQTTP
ncbi:MAG: tyrosine-protein phosphatase [Candidatus Omnitrophota bacterium]